MVMSAWWQPPSNDTHECAPDALFQPTHPHHVLAGWQAQACEQGRVSCAHMKACKHAQHGGQSKAGVNTSSSAGLTVRLDLVGCQAGSRSLIHAG